MNTYLPALVAERYRNSRIVDVFDWQCLSAAFPGQRRRDRVHAGRSYWRICTVRIGRERMFENGSARWGTPVTILRLNYAVELRYGVLVDIGRAVFEGRPISLSMPFVNVIWQRDANSWCLRSFAHCQSPPFVLNITGPETLSVREIAREFGKHSESNRPSAMADGSTALLSDASRAQTFWNPTVTPAEMIEWIADGFGRGRDSEQAHSLSDARRKF